MIRNRNDKDGHKLGAGVYSQNDVKLREVEMNPGKPRDISKRVDANGDVNDGFSGELGK